MEKFLRNTEKSLRINNSSFEYICYKQASEIPDIYLEGIQKAFLQCHEINDINLKKDTNCFKDYLGSQSVIITLEDNYPIMFTIISFNNQFKYYDIGIYINFESNLLDFKKHVQYLCKAYPFFVEPDFKYNGLCFDVYLPIVYKWVSKIYGEGSLFTIYRGYYICHIPFTKSIYNNLYKNGDFIVKHFKTD